MGFAPQPDPSTVEPGSLYVDAQSRAIWLGVDESIDPNGSVLVSDINALLESDAASVAAANAHTDAVALTLAPLNHTHDPEDINDFAEAVEEVVNGIPGFNWVPGMILMWSGSLASIGVGNLAGWALCDGQNGTPDLRDRFIIGAGNKSPGDKDSLDVLTTSQDPGHTHTISQTVLTVAQMPSHTHGPGSLQGPLVGGTAYSAGDHQHLMNMWSRQDSGSAVAGTWAVGGSSDQGDQYTPIAGAHTHVVGGTAQLNAGTSGFQGGGGSHNHTESIAGVHSHTITKNNLREATPYYALAFIIKL